MEDKPFYSIPYVDKAVTWFINLIFFSRLFLVALALFFLSKTAIKVWQQSLPQDKFKDIAIVFGLGSVSIGIFYSILNYEHGQIKSKRDAQSSRYTLSFNSVCEWHRPTMVANLKITKQLYDKHRHLIDEDRGKEFFEILEKDEEARSALVSILNYFEVLSTGVRLGLLDNNFIKDSLKSVAKQYIVNYGFYIKYRRAVHNVSSMWEEYTNLVEQWKD